MAESSFTLAKVKVSKEHHYLRFAYILLFVVAIAIVIGWAWYEGYVTLMVQGMGVACTLIFVALLFAVGVLGVSLGFRCSRDINALKEIANDRKALMRAFDMNHYDENGFDFVCRQVDRITDRALRTLEFSQEVTLQAGFVGMLIGMLIAITQFHALINYNQDTVGPLMPMFFIGLAIAVWSSLASILVWFVAAGFMLLIHNSYDVFSERADRAFYNIPKQ
ncbi:hypothetical protein HY413_04055 [Candidatus Kaiserbacteria bacterium]|nr:hypothetical protein [Candidatus Kaiserbacteria bacterium]